MAVPPFIPTDPQWAWVGDLVVGQSWPQGDEDAMRRCAQYWTDALTGLLEVAGHGNRAAQQVNYSVQAVSSQQFNDYWAQYVNGDNSYYGQLAQQAEGLAGLLLQQAEQVEFTKWSIDIQVVVLLIQLLWDFVIAPLTAGASMAEGMAAALVTRLTVKKILWELLKAVLMAVIPDFVTQTVMILDHHRGGYDLGELGQAAQMGLVAGGVGMLLGGLGGKVTAGLGKAFGTVLDEQGTHIAAGLVNAGLHGAATNMITNPLVGALDTGEQQLFDPQGYAQQQQAIQQEQQQAQEFGYAQVKSNENPLMAGLNGAFTGMLFHGGHLLQEKPVTTFHLPDDQQLTGIKTGDNQYSLFDSQGKLHGTGTVDEQQLTVTPTQGDPYTTDLNGISTTRYGHTETTSFTDQTTPTVEPTTGTTTLTSFQQPTTEPLVTTEPLQPFQPLEPIATTPVVPEAIPVQPVEPIPVEPQGQLDIPVAPTTEPLPVLTTGTVPTAEPVPTPITNPTDPNALHLASVEPGAEPVTGPLVTAPPEQRGPVVATPAELPAELPAQLLAQPPVGAVGAPVTDVPAEPVSPFASALSGPAPGTPGASVDDVVGTARALRGRLTDLPKLNLPVDETVTRLRRSVDRLVNLLDPVPSAAGEPPALAPTDETRRTLAEAKALLDGFRPSDPRIEGTDPVRINRLADDLDRLTARLTDPTRTVPSEPVPHDVDVVRDGTWYRFHWVQREVFGVLRMEDMRVALLRGDNHEPVDFWEGDNGYPPDQPIAGSIFELTDELHQAVLREDPGQPVDEHGALDRPLQIDIRDPYFSGSAFVAVRSEFRDAAGSAEPAARLDRFWREYLAIRDAITRLPEDAVNRRSSAHESLAGLTRAYLEELGPDGPPADLRAAFQGVADLLGVTDPTRPDLDQRVLEAELERLDLWKRTVARAYRDDPRALAAVDDHYAKLADQLRDAATRAGRGYLDEIRARGERVVDDTHRVTLSEAVPSYDAQRSAKSRIEQPIDFRVVETVGPGDWPGTRYLVTEVPIRYPAGVAADSTAARLLEARARLGIERRANLYLRDLVDADGRPTVLKVEFTHYAAAPADRIPVEVRAGEGRASEGLWFLDSTPDVLAHELMHRFGLRDEYFDEETRTPTRMTGDAAGIRPDATLMNEHYRPDAQVFRRHVDLIDTLVRRESLGLLRDRRVVQDPSFRPVMDAAVKGFDEAPKVLAALRRLLPDRWRPAEPPSGADPGLVGGARRALREWGAVLGGDPPEALRTVAEAAQRLAAEASWMKLRLSDFAGLDFDDPRVHQLVERAARQLGDHEPLLRIGEALRRYEAATGAGDQDAVRAARRALLAGTRAANSAARALHDVRTGLEPISADLAVGSASRAGWTVDRVARALADLRGAGTGTGGFEDSLQAYRDELTRLKDATSRWRGNAGTTDPGWLAQLGAARTAAADAMAAAVDHPELRRALLLDPRQPLPPQEAARLRAALADLRTELDARTARLRGALDEVDRRSGPPPPGHWPTTPPAPAPQAREGGPAGPPGRWEANSAPVPAGVPFDGVLAWQGSRQIQHGRVLVDQPAYGPTELTARVAAWDALPPDPQGRYTLVIDDSIVGALQPGTVADLIAADPAYRPGQGVRLIMADALRGREPFAVLVGEQLGEHVLAPLGRPVFDPAGGLHVVADEWTAGGQRVARQLDDAWTAVPPDRYALPALPDWVTDAGAGLHGRGYDEWGERADAIRATLAPPDVPHGGTLRGLMFGRGALGDADEATKAWLGSVLGLDVDGIRAEITKLRYGERQLSVELRMIGPDGGTVGMAEQVLSIRGGRLEMRNVLLTLDRRGTGFGTAFSDRVEDLAIGQGVDAITLRAQQIGGYAWARRGYEFADLASMRAVVARVEQRVEAGEMSAAGLRDWARLAARATEAAWHAGDPVTPYEISELGIAERTGTGTEAAWDGRKILLGSSWEGVKRLVPPEQHHPEQPGTHDGSIHARPLDGFPDTGGHRPRVVSGRARVALAGIGERHPELDGFTVLDAHRGEVAVTGGGHAAVFRYEVGPTEDAVATTRFEGYTGDGRPRYVIRFSETIPTRHPEFTRIVETAADHEIGETFARLRLGDAELAARPDETDLLPPRPDAITPHQIGRVWGELPSLLTAHGDAPATREGPRLRGLLPALGLTDPVLGPGRLEAVRARGLLRPETDAALTRLLTEHWTIADKYQRWPGSTEVGRMPESDKGINWLAFEKLGQPFKDPDAEFYGRRLVPALWYEVGGERREFHGDFLDAFGWFVERKFRSGAKAIPADEVRQYQDALDFWANRPVAVKFPGLDLSDAAQLRRLTGLLTGAGVPAGEVPAVLDRLTGFDATGPAGRARLVDLLTRHGVADPAAVADAVRGGRYGGPLAAEAMARALGAHDIDRITANTIVWAVRDGILADAGIGAAEVRQALVDTYSGIERRPVDLRVMLQISNQEAAYASQRSYGTLPLEQILHDGTYNRLLGAFNDVVKAALPGVTFGTKDPALNQLDHDLATLQNRRQFTAIEQLLRDRGATDQQRIDAVVGWLRDGRMPGLVVAGPDALHPEAPLPEDPTAPPLSQSELFDRLSGDPAALRRFYERFSFGGFLDESPLTFVNDTSPDSVAARLYEWQAEQRYGGLDQQRPGLWRASGGWTRFDAFDRATNTLIDRKLFTGPEAVSGYHDQFLRQADAMVAHPYLRFRLEVPDEAAAREARRAIATWGDLSEQVRGRMEVAVVPFDRATAVAEYEARPGQITSLADAGAWAHGGPVDPDGVHGQALSAAAELGPRGGRGLRSDRYWLEYDQGRELLLASPAGAGARVAFRFEAGAVPEGVKAVTVRTAEVTAEGARVYRVTVAHDMPLADRQAVVNRAVLHEVREALTRVREQAWWDRLLGRDPLAHAVGAFGSGTAGARVTGHDVGQAAELRAELDELRHAQRAGAVDRSVATVRRIGLLLDHMGIRAGTTTDPTDLATRLSILAGTTPTTSGPRLPTDLHLSPDELDLIRGLARPDAAWRATALEDRLLHVRQALGTATRSLLTETTGASGAGGLLAGSAGAGGHSAGSMTGKPIAEAHWDPTGRILTVRPHGGAPFDIDAGPLADSLTSGERLRATALADLAHRLSATSPSPDLATAQVFARGVDALGLDSQPEYQSEYRRVFDTMLRDLPADQQATLTTDPTLPTALREVARQRLTDTLLDEAAPTTATPGTLAWRTPTGNLAVATPDGRVTELPLTEARQRIHRLVTDGVDLPRLRAETTAELGARAAGGSTAGERSRAVEALGALARLRDAAGTPVETRVAAEALAREILADHPTLATEIVAGHSALASETVAGHQRPTGQSLVGQPGAARRVGGVPEAVRELARDVLAQQVAPTVVPDPAPGLRPGRYADTAGAIANELADLRGGVVAGSAEAFAKVEEVAGSARRVAVSLDKAAAALEERAEAHEAEAKALRESAREHAARGRVEEERRDAGQARRGERIARAYRTAAGEARRSAGAYREVAEPLDALGQGVREGRLGATAPGRLLEVATDAELAARAAHKVYEDALAAAGPAVEALHAGVPTGHLPHLDALTDRVNRLLEGSGVRVTPHELEARLRATFRDAAAGDGVVLRFGAAEVRIRLRMADPVEVTDPDVTAAQVIIGQFPQDGRPGSGSGGRSRGWSLSAPLSDMLKGLAARVPEAGPVLAGLLDVLSVRGGVGAGDSLSYANSGTDYNQTGAVADNRGRSTLYDLDAAWEVARPGGGWETVGEGGAERVRLWVPHPYTEPAPERTVVSPDPPATQQFPEHVLTGMTGLGELGDAVIDRLPPGYRDPAVLAQIRAGLGGLPAELGSALHEDGHGFWFPIVHEGRTVGVVRVRAEVVPDAYGAAGQPVGTASDEVHLERLRIAFSSAGASVSSGTSWHRDGELDVAGQLPGGLPLLGGDKLGGSPFSRSWSTADSDAMNVGGTAIHPMVGRFAGHTQAYRMEFRLDATVELTGETPASASATSRALLRMAEPDAYRYGLPVDADGLAGGELRDGLYQPDPRRYGTSWPDWLAHGAGHATVRGLTGLDTARDRLAQRLTDEGFLPRFENGRLVLAEHPVQREAQLANLREFDRQFSAASLEGRYDQAAQDGLLLDLVRPRATGPAEHAVFRIRLERPVPEFRGLTDAERIVNLNIASDSLGRSTGETHSLTSKADFHLGGPGGPGFGGSGDIAAQSTGGRGAGRSYGNTVNDVQLLESTGSAAVFTVDHRLVVERLDAPMEVLRADGVTAEVLLPAELLDVTRRPALRLTTGTSTDPAVLSRVKVVHLDATGLMDRVREVLPNSTSPDSPALAQLTSLVNARSLAAHAKELFEGQLGTDLAVSSRGLRPLRGALRLAAEAGGSEYLGTTDMVLGDINFTLGSQGSSVTGQQGGEFDLSGDGAFSAALSGDVKPAFDRQVSGSTTESRLAIVGRENLAITMGRAYLYRVPLDLTVSGGEHGVLLAGRGTEPPPRHSAATMVYALAEPEALALYGKGTLPVSPEHVADAIRRWEAGELELPRNDAARMLDRYLRESPPTDEASRQRAGDLARRLADRYPDAGDGTQPLDPVERIHRLATAGLPDVPDGSRLLPEHLREHLGNSVVESLDLTDTAGRPVRLYDRIVAAIHEVAPDALRRLPGLREGLRSQFGGSRWFAGGHPHTMEELDGLTLRLMKVPAGPFFAEDITVRLRLVPVTVEDAHGDLLDDLARGRTGGTGIEQQDYLYDERSRTTTSGTTTGGGTTGDAGVPSVTPSVGGTGSRGRTYGSTVDEQRTRVGYFGDFAGVDRFGRPVRVVLEVERSRSRGQWGGWFAAAADALSGRNQHSSYREVLHGELVRLVPSAVVLGPEAHPETRYQLPDPRLVSRWPERVKVIGSSGDGLADALGRRLAGRDLLGERGLYANRGALESALNALTRNATLPAMASPEGHTLVELPDPRNPGRVVAVHVKVRAYDLHLSQTGLEGERLGAVDRMQRTTGRSTGESRAIPVTGSGGTDLTIADVLGDQFKPSPGLSIGEQLGGGTSATAGNRDETTLKEEGPSSVVRVRLHYDVTLTTRDRAGGSGEPVYLPNAAHGHAYLQLFDADLADVHRRLEEDGTPGLWRAGSATDEAAGWRLQRGLDERYRTAPTFDLATHLADPTVDPRRPELRLAELIDHQLRHQDRSGAPVIRLTASESAPRPAAWPPGTDPHPLTQARNLAHRLGTEVVLDLTGRDGTVRRYVAMPDGSLHAVGPDAGLAATLATLPPDLLAEATRQGLDLPALYRESAGRFDTFAAAVRAKLAAL